MKRYLYPKTSAQFILWILFALFALTTIFLTGIMLFGGTSVLEIVSLGRLALALPFL